MRLPSRPGKRKVKKPVSSSSRLIYTSLLYPGPPPLMRNTGTAAPRRPASFPAHMDELKLEPPWLVFTQSQDIYLYSPLRTQKWLLQMCSDLSPHCPPTHPTSCYLSASRCITAKLLWSSAKRSLVLDVWGEKGKVGDFLLHSILPLP